MSKIAISTGTYFADAIISLLSDSGYASAGAAGDCAFVLVNTDKRTFKDGEDAGDRAIYNPASQWSLIQSLIAGQATPAAATAPAASSQPYAVSGRDATNGMNGEVIRVGDQVKAINKPDTRGRFRLDSRAVYTVDRITAKGNIGLAHNPNDEYVASRFRRANVAARGAASVGVDINISAPSIGVGNVSLNNGPRVQVASPGYRTTPTVTASLGAAQTSTIAPFRPAVDGAGNTLRVGDTVIVKTTVARRRRFNVLPENRALVIDRITRKGAIGFVGMPQDEYLAKRFQKVAVQDIQVGRDGRPVNLRSGDLLQVVRQGSNRLFDLPINSTVTFRGLTVEGNKFILDGYHQHQYAPSRFWKLSPLGVFSVR